MKYAMRDAIKDAIKDVIRDAIIDLIKNDEWHDWEPDESRDKECD